MCEPFASEKSNTNVFNAAIVCTPYAMLPHPLALKRTHTPNNNRTTPRKRATSTNVPGQYGWAFCVDQMLFGFRFVEMISIYCPAHFDIRFLCVCASVHFIVCSVASDVDGELWTASFAAVLRLRVLLSLRSVWRCATSNLCIMFSCLFT